MFFSFWFSVFVIVFYDLFLFERFKVGFFSEVGFEGREGLRF